MRSAFVLLFLAACAKPAPPRPRSTPLVLAAKVVESAATKRAPPIDAVVLLETGGSSLLYADGAVADTSLDELRMMAHGEVVTLDQPHAQKKYRCNGTLDDYDSISLSLVDAAAKETVLVPPLPYVGANDAYTFDKQNVTVTAVLGPNVVAEVWHDEWSCGAMHPSFGNEGHRFVAETGREKPLAPPPSASTEAALRLATQGLNDGDVHFEQAVVRFDPDGAATIDWIFWKEATYVDGIPRTTITTPLPPSLAKLRTPPPSVAAFLRAHPQRLKGWSQ